MDINHLNDNLLAANKKLYFVLGAVISGLNCLKENPDSEKIEELLRFASSETDILLYSKQKDEIYTKSVIDAQIKSFIFVYDGFFNDVFKIFMNHTQGKHIITPHCRFAVNYGDALHCLFRGYTNLISHCPANK